MRYLVKARVKPGKEQALLTAIEDGTLGRGSVAGGEYLWDMQQARMAHDGTAHWVEVCFCRIPLEEERPYWEEYFDSISFISPRLNPDFLRTDHFLAPDICDRLILHLRANQ